MIRLITAEKSVAADNGPCPCAPDETGNSWHQMELGVELSREGAHEECNLVRRVSKAGRPLPEIS